MRRKGTLTALKRQEDAAIVTVQSRGSPVAYYLGKFLELNGIVLLGFGLFWGLMRDDVRGEVGLLGLGVAIFLAGYWFERRFSRKS